MVSTSYFLKAVFGTAHTVGTVGKMYIPRTEVEPLLQSGCQVNQQSCVLNNLLQQFICWLHLVLIYVLCDVLYALVMFVVILRFI